MKVKVEVKVNAKYSGSCGWMDWVDGWIDLQCFLWLVMAIDWLGY